MKTFKGHAIPAGNDDVLISRRGLLAGSVGAAVGSGQAIGETGDTGITGENTLYFELRQGTEAVDPLQWLARR